MPAPVLVEGRQRLAAGDCQRQDVHLQHLPPVLRGSIVKARLAAQPGIVDEDVEPAPASPGLLENPPDVFGLAQIGRHQQGRLGAPRGDPVAEGFKTIFPASGERELDAPGGELKGDGLADPARGPGDNRNASGQVHIPARPFTIS